MLGQIDSKIEKKKILFEIIKFILQVLMNLDKSAKDIAGPVTIYIAQLIHLFLHFWQAQFLLDYSVLPYESM